MGTEIDSDKKLFEDAIEALRSQVLSASVHVTMDSQARLMYMEQIGEMSRELRQQVALGKLSWKQAAEQAQEARNLIMEVMRGKSTPVGRAIAEKTKRHGRTLNDVIARNTQKLFGNGANFNNLPSSSKEAVYAEVVKSAGKSDPVMTNRIQRLAPAARGLVVLSIAVAVYNVAVAEDKMSAAGREVVIAGAGVGGGFAGGAVAGLACGPGAPVCVTIGAFVGGALSAFGVSMFW